MVLGCIYLLLKDMVHEQLTLLRDVGIAIWTDCANQSKKSLRYPSNGHPCPVYYPRHLIYVVHLQEVSLVKGNVQSREREEESCASFPS